MFGKTRQAYYEETWAISEETVEYVTVIDLVNIFRRYMPRIGTRKLYHLLQEPFQQHGLKIGRDKLFSLLAENKMLVKKRRRRTKTTYSQHWLRKYPNLIKELNVTRPEQLWVSDITYIRVGKEYNYLSLITDAYSRRIMGYCLHRTLDTKGCLNALKMALHKRSGMDKLIHHSDRGIQYCSFDYTLTLKELGIEISMTENGDPYENALAERINGILKDEFNLSDTFQNHSYAAKAVEEKVNIYNTMRPHASCNYLTPVEAHQQVGELKCRW